LFNEPVQVVFNGANDEELYIVEKEGFIQRASIKHDTLSAEVFLDITDRVGVTNDEEGLLSAAFHPEFLKNNYVYVWYSAQKPKRGVLSRFTYNNELKQLDKKTEQVILEIQQPWGNHNGGTVLFGPDGLLYLGVGDGGAANDPYNNSQNKNTLLGSIIRIDINKTGGDNQYAIPPTNPLVNQDGCREEVWAWGLRNPWRMSFDRITNDLYVGDVGQNAWEEVDIVRGGGNYGWNFREGKHPFQKKESSEKNLIDPIYEYGRRGGGSITGGYVYRGLKLPALYGSYIFSDYLSAKVWFLKKNKNNEYIATRIAKKTPISIASFGESPQGEIFACGFSNPYGSKGKIYRLSSEISPEPTPSTIR